MLTPDDFALAKPWTLAMVDKYIREVRDDLMSGAIGPDQFDMGTVFCPIMRTSDDGDMHCGSVGCIGGWMVHKKMVDNNETYRNVLKRVVREVTDLCDERGEALRELFYKFPNHDDRDITPAMAVTAINLWLAGATTNPWDGVEFVGCDA